GRWEVMLPEAEQAAVVTVAAIARDGRVVARDECIVAAPEPPRGLRRWLRRQPAGTARRAHGRGSVIYGPGSVR
ncbi:MAG TPA: hypothetical protein VG474_06055, partial [Solirubrobacteraceae bacterium]|nr:hypothetical protein [Solirubrobacteraceae bacterium]